jgi:predicted lipoprotein with Yx(FWY)xxD motif
VHVTSRLLNSRVAAAGAVAVVLALAGTALAGATTASQVKTRETSLGTILVDGKGKTLYLFGKDKSGKSSCYGACAANWPPYLTSGKPRVGPGVKASLLGTTKRTNGKLQVTYDHHPLYHFKYDSRAGQTSGEDVHAFGANWYAVSPKGSKVEPASNGGGGYGGGPTGPTGPTGSGGYGGGPGGYGPP